MSKEIMEAIKKGIEGYGEANLGRRVALSNCFFASVIATGAGYVVWKMCKNIILEDARLAEQKARAQNK